MVTISMGNKKRSFKSIKEAAAFHGMPYMTFYMRMKALNWKPITAASRKVRKYIKH